MERVLYTTRLLEKACLSERAQCFHLTFEIEGVSDFVFIAGQFVSLVAPDALGKQQTRAYSIASAPRANQYDLCVNRVEGGFFSNLLADMQVGDTMKMHGPHGLFTLREPLGNSIFIATGTGVAPMRGFIEWLYPTDGPSRLPDGKTVTLVYGTRHADDIYYHDFFACVAQEHKSFRYIATLSRGGEDWTGERGYVQEHVLRALGDHARMGAPETEPPPHPERDLAANPRQTGPDTFPIHAYICGLNDMVSANRDQLKELGWHRKQVVFERYD